MEIIKRKYEHKNNEEIVKVKKENISRADYVKEYFQISFNSDNRIILRLYFIDIDENKLLEEYLFSLDKYESGNLINFIKERIK